MGNLGENKKQAQSYLQKLSQDKDIPRREMRKKEVRWISRDFDRSVYEVWYYEPNITDGWWRGRGYICQLSGMAAHSMRIKLKSGGLAKVTIERQY